jgi:FtsP/CotA-like multicopper oxidase with cupredoxin domain
MMGQLAARPDFSGRFVLHCHMMNHEELGMMQVVEVVAS